MQTTPQPAARSRTALADRDQLRVLDLAGNKWVVLAVAALATGPRRYSQIAHDLRWVGPKMLTQTLRRLEGAGLVTRTVIAGVPVQVSYSLTPLGRSLVEVTGPTAWVRENAAALESGEGQ